MTEDAMKCEGVQQHKEKGEKIIGQLNKGTLPLR